MIINQSLQSNYHQSNEDQEPIKVTSILFERITIFAIVGLLIIAIWYKYIPFIIICIFVLALTFLVNLWKSMSLKNVKPEINLSKSRLFVNDEFQINVSINNEKWLPLVWLEWCFSKSPAISLGKNESGIYIVRFLWLLWFQKIEWSISGKALLRGVYNIGDIRLRSGDGFRFTETEKSFNLDGRIFIYPKLISVQVPDFNNSMQWGINGKRGGFIEDPLLVIGTREYQPGDELRRFNWRASARTGKLQTNIYQPVVMEQLFIYIDTAGFVINESEHQDIYAMKEYVSKKRESFERFISIIASIAVKYKNQGISIGFASNGLNYLDKRMPIILPGTNLTPFLDELARITQKVIAKRMSILEEMLYEGKLNMPLLIYCEKVTEKHYMWYQNNKNKLSDTTFYYRVDNEFSKKLNTIAKPMEKFVSSVDSSVMGL